MDRPLHKAKAGGVEPGAQGSKPGSIQTVSSQNLSPLEIKHTVEEETNCLTPH